LGLIGFTAVIAQVMLMRELLVVFYSNELALVRFLRPSLWAL
jgi:hypothetical protein